MGAAMTKKRRCYRLLRWFFGEDWDRLPSDWKGRVRWFFGADEKHKKTILGQSIFWGLWLFLTLRHFSGNPIDQDMKIFLSWLDDGMASVKEWVIGCFL